MRIVPWKYSDVPIGHPCLDHEPKIVIERGQRSQGIYVEELGIVRSKSDVEDPYWVMISLGNKDGTIQGMTCYFESKHEQEQWLERGIMYMM
jgi:hypothetical protein